MKVLRISLAIMFALALAGSALAQPDAKTQQMMDEISEKTEKIDSCKVDMKIETQMMGQMMVTDGKMTFKRPKKMHMVTSAMGMNQEIFTKGNIVWTYMPAMKMATKIDLSKVQQAMPEQPGMGMGSDISQPFKGFPADKIRFIETRTEGDVKVHVFEASPSMPGQAPPGHPSQMLPKRIRLMISADNGLPHKMQMLADDGSIMMQQTYSNIKINIPVDDSEFDFVPPEDVQVMDMTQGPMNMMQQMQGSGTKSQ